ncbi:MAG: hypothetical protein AAFP90_12865 [Planctomycetota bacterium]
MNHHRLHNKLPIILNPNQNRGNNPPFRATNHKRSIPVAIRVADLTINALLGGFSVLLLAITSVFNRVVKTHQEQRQDRITVTRF